MARDRLVTVFIVLASLTVCTVVVWLLFYRPVHEHTTVSPALIVVQPLSTPLRDSIREPRRRGSKVARRRTPTSVGSRRSAESRGRTPAKSPTRAGLIKKRKNAPKPKRRRKTPSHPQNTAPAPQNGSQTPQKPLVGVTLPAPANACLDGLVGVNCP